MAYRAVVFDLYNTLIPDFTAEDHLAALANMADAVGIEIDVFRKTWGGFNAQRWDGTHASTTATVRAICKALSHNASDVAIAAAVAFRDDLRMRYFTPRPDAVSVLTEVRRRGLRTALLSDCGAETPAVWPTSPLAALIEAPVFSCEVGCRKPEPRIYAIACDRLGVSPTECVYIGDGGSRELTGATAAGMTAIQLRADDRAWNAVPGREDWTGRSVPTLTELLDQPELMRR